ncbi:unnamed protein product [Rhizophagus irregularis]|uniref:Uncharacterized protein n=1 Tax=Rhizophagus irregularis TaxID=588596 RepID=A0A915YPT8_9GLOM|nr:unnamed protein product [Rhizophagus irregularis]
MDISYILIFFPSIVIAQSDKEQNNDDAFIDNLFFTILPIIISIIAFTDKENDHIHYGYWVNLFHTVVSSHLLPLVLSIINEFATEDAPRAISWFTIYRVPIGTVRFRFESYRNQNRISVSVIDNLPNFRYR